MDAVFQFWALIAIAVAIYCGLMSIATSISKLRMSAVDLHFPNPIKVEHRGGDGTPT